MNPDRAFEIAERLGVLENYPHSAKAVGQIGEMIAQMCPTDEQGEWLLSELTLSGRYTKWAGPGWLKEIWRDKFGTRQQREEWKAWEADREVGPLCETCQSWGHVIKDERYQRCQCVAGQTLDQKVLNHLNARIRPRDASAATEPIPRVTEADFQAIIAKVRPN